MSVTERGQKSQNLLIEDAGRISLLSHDIRSTFAELQSGLSTLDHIELPPHLTGDVQQLVATGAHLGRLLDEVASLVFHDHKQRPATRLMVNPRDILTKLALRWQRITTRFGSSLHLEGLETMPTRADLDMLSLERVLSNLVSNALHHAGPGQISLKVSRQATENGINIIVRICDTGPGFPPHVFTSHEGRPPIQIGSGEPGSGYGLYVACDAARRLGGRLTLRNLPEAGAEACLILPIHADQGLNHWADQWSETAPPPQKPLYPMLRSYTALLVEDSDTLRLTMHHNLETLGLTVVDATDGAEALDILSDPGTTIDLVFLDIELPLVSGPQVIAALRKRGVTPPPVIAVTSHVFDLNMQAIRATGVHDILSKPFPSKTAILHVTCRALGLPLPVTDQDPAPPAYQTTNAPLGLHDLTARLPKAVAEDVLTRLSADLTRYLGLGISAAKSIPSQDAKNTLRLATHSLSGLFATAHRTKAQNLARHVSEQADVMPRAEIIAILETLRQTVTDIQKSIHLLIHSETDTNVPKTNFDR